MKSNNLTQVDWIQAPEAKPVDLPLEIIVRRPDFHSAFLLSIEVSGLEDKQIYGPLDIDAGQWSRIRKGQSFFPMNKLNKFMDIVGNEIVLQWQANKRGFELSPLRSSLELKLEAAQKKIAEQAREIEIIQEFSRVIRK